jgi:23S rRNA (cytosine1962-C5)-methyltransferase
MNVPQAAVIRAMSMFRSLFIMTALVMFTTMSYRLVPQRTRLLSTRWGSSTGYEFVDSGGYKRLEHFAKIKVSRSCPSASWPADTPVIHDKDVVCYDGTSGKAGTWQNLHLLPANWQVSFDISSPDEEQEEVQGDEEKKLRTIVFTLSASDLGQVGVFPEQQANWRWIRRTLRSSSLSASEPALPRKVLNGFAYTGGSTMAALSAGNVQVVHLDAAKSLVQWATRNALASGLYNPNSSSSDSGSGSSSDSSSSSSSSSSSGSSSSSSSGSRSVRWITDDCVTFLEREVRRGNRYDGLIFDPPAFGRGGSGKIWKLENDLPVLVDTLIPQLLSDDPSFVLLSCHDVDWPPSRLAQLLRAAVVKKAASAGPQWLGGRARGKDRGALSSNDGELQSVTVCGGVLECGPMVLMPDDAASQVGRPLPLGGFARWRCVS